MRDTNEPPRITFFEGVLLGSIATCAAVLIEMLGG